MDEVGSDPFILGSQNLFSGSICFTTWKGSMAMAIAMPLPGWKSWPPKKPIATCTWEWRSRSPSTLPKKQVAPKKWWFSIRISFSRGPYFQLTDRVLSIPEASPWESAACGGNLCSLMLPTGWRVSDQWLKSQILVARMSKKWQKSRTKRCRKHRTLISLTLSH